MPISVARADAGQKAALFIGEGLQALALDFFQKLVHAAFLGLAALLLALLALLCPLLEPALKEVRSAAPRRYRLVALQAGVSLREVVTKQRFFPARFEQNPLLPASDPNEQRQAEQQQLVHDQGDDADEQHHDEPGIDGRRHSLAKIRPPP